jgi:homocitrate synthase
MLNFIKVHFTSRLTGWNAIKSRAEQLGYHMTDNEYKECTAKIKSLADVKKLGLDDTDAIIRSFHKLVTAESPRPVKGANGTDGAVKEALDLSLPASTESNGDSNGHAEVPPPTDQMKEFLATEKA